MQLLVALPVLVALFYFNAASVIQNSRDVDPESSRPKDGTDFQPKYPKGSDDEMLSRHMNVSNRIIGGYTARERDTPWVAAIYLDGSYICSGVVVHKYWVLTAGRCVVTNRPGQPHVKASTESLKVVIGDVNLNFRKFINVIDVEYHNNFYRGTDDVRYDFGLLKVDERQPSSRLICLSTNIVSSGDHGRVYGFGRTSYTSPASSVLKYYYINFLNATDCLKDWNNKWISLDQSKICHKGHFRNEGSCLGDSGGPVGFMSKGRFKLIGVQSFVSGICNTNKADIAAQVKFGSPWIKKIVGKYKKC